MTEEQDPTQARRARVDAIFAAMSNADWGRIHQELVAYGLARWRSTQKAEDLAQEAMMRVLDARWDPWDPDKQPDLTRFLMSIMNRNFSNDRKTEKGHREIRMEADELGKLPDERQTPELVTANRELCAKRTLELRKRLADDAEALERLTQFEAGVDTPEEQQAETGREMLEIRTSRRRLFYHAENVKRDIPGDIGVPPEALLLAPKPAAATRPKRRRPTTATARAAPRAGRRATGNEEEEP